MLAHVKRILHDRSEWSRAYKVRIKKEFKVTESGKVALSYGRILTPSHGASCGIKLKPGRRYLLTGNIRSGKPWINLCNFVHDWDKMTPIQRKGFRRLYAKGCDCKVTLGLACLVNLTRPAAPFGCCPTLRQASGAANRNAPICHKARSRSREKSSSWLNGPVALEAEHESNRHVGVMITENVLSGLFRAFCR